MSKHHVKRTQRAVVVLAVAIAPFTSCSAEHTEGFVLVTSGATDQVFMLRAETGVVEDSIVLDPRRGEVDEPHGIAATSDHAHWYVTVSHGEPTLWKFETAGNRLVGRVPLAMSGASRIGVTTDGKVAYIPDYYRDDVEVLGEVTAMELHSLTTIAKKIVCAAPHDAQPAPNGVLVAVACSASDEVVFLDPRTLATMHTVKIVGHNNGRPLNLVWAPDAESVYVTLNQARAVVQVSPTGGVLGTVAVGPGPAQLAMAPAGNLLVTANRLDGSASLVATDSLVEIARIPLGVSHPHGVTISQDGRLAFITYEGDTDTQGGVVAIDMTQKTVHWRRDVGTYTLGVTYITHN